MLAAESAFEGQPQVIHGPTRHHGVVRENDEAGRHSQPANHGPRPAAQLAESSHRIFMGMTADHHLGEHDRDPDDHDAEEIEENEGPAAVHAGDVGEFPDIAEPDCRAGRSHDKAEATAPVSARCSAVIFFHHSPS